MSVVWHGKPPFPETDLPSTTRRFKLSESLYVDWDGVGSPSQAWVDAQAVNAATVPKTLVDVLIAKGVISPGDLK